MSRRTVTVAALAVAVLLAAAATYWALTERQTTEPTAQPTREQAPPTEVVATIPIDDAIELMDIEVMPAGSTVLVAGQRDEDKVAAVYAIDTSTNSLATTIDLAPESSASDLAVLPDGSSVYVASNQGENVSVIDPTSDSVVATIPMIFPWAQSVAPDGSAVYVRSSEGVARIDTSTNAVVATYPFNTTGISASTQLEVTPDGSAVYTTQTAGASVLVIDTARNSLAFETPVDDGPIAVAFLPDGSRAYVVNHGHWDTEAQDWTPLGQTVSVVDTETGSVVATIPVGERPADIAVHPDGSAVYVTNYGNDSVSVIDTAQNKVVATIPVGDEPWPLALLPDGSAVYVANQADGTVSVIDTDSNTVVAALPVGDAPIQLVALPDGSAVYVANMKDHSVTVIGKPGR